MEKKIEYTEKEKKRKQHTVFWFGKNRKTFGSFSKSAENYRGRFKNNLRINDITKIHSSGFKKNYKIGRT